MKATITAITLTLFAGTAMAATDQDVYAGFAKNPDLGHDMSHTDSGSSQRGMGDSNPVYSSRTTRADVYRGFEEGNPDL